MQRARIAVVLATAVSATGLISAPTHAQEPGTGLTVGMAFATQYPDRFQEGCGNPAGAVPSVRAHHRIHRLLTAELGVSAHIQIPPGRYCSIDAVPLMDGDVVRDFDVPRGSVSLAGEARLVLTPLTSKSGTLRLIGGGAWYPSQNVPAWIVGAGYRPLTSWGAWVIDIERWNVGVEYELERFRTGAPREPLGDGREWQALWQIRIGITLWSSR
jgi:hypothetical protein